MKTPYILLIVLSLFAVSCVKQNNFPSGQWIDLSYDFSDKTNYWVESDGFKKETVAEGPSGKGYYYSAYRFCAPEHGGTHIDAPLHFAEAKNSVDQIPLDQLIRTAVKIDVSAKAAANRDYLITSEDISAWEAQNGEIPNGAIVLLYTGFGAFWSDRAKYMGVDGDQKHFPGLAKEAAEWLMRKRNISAVGIDTASIDYGQSQTFDTHVALMSENIPAFENVANLDKVPTKGSQIIALPMKIKGGSGAPLRIVAFVPN